MNVAPHRFLGFAFACADLLVEVDSHDRITFAVGAAATLTGTSEVALVGRSWRDFVHPADCALVEALFAGLEDGARQGPVLARLADNDGASARAFALSACRLPQNGGVVSCAMTRAAPAAGAATDGLLDRAAFETVTRSLVEAARSAGQELELAFLEMDGFSKASRGLAPDTAKALQTRLHGALRAQSHGGAAAADLGDDRFALVRNSGESAEALTTRLTRLIALTAEIGDVRIAARSLALDGEVAPSKVVRAIRYAMDDFLREGMNGAPLATLTDAVEESVRHTLEKANALGSVVAKREFNLVYQPVVALATGELHHHEVLVRFGDNASPFPMIRMAEELDLIEGLDLAILDKACAEMTRDPALSLAVNVSGRSIVSPTFMDGVQHILKGKKAIKPRLMFEITESAAIDDLALADRNIQALRTDGSQVCLDDFGAGAASLAYLQQLRLDVVKIDGRYIRELQHGGRESNFIRQLVRMCQELSVRTLAEMVETHQAAEAVRAAGVDYAQGWHYGAAAATPQPPVNHMAAARRVGAKDSWG
ncbi:MAG: sensor domain-containing phosphodiesterase [Proteobacteria bacterium]|nr:sensor domain-containing phosphodiesterase [Pseudomonadota bacterium]